MKIILLISLFIAMIISVHTSAQIPQTMSYQGVINNIDGSLVQDGLYTMKFKLYNALTGGDSLWQEIQNVHVTNGLFNVILGSVVPLNLPFDKQYWLGISIGNEVELTPRTALTASPYSLNSYSTLVEPQPGQGLTIRNSNGEATHQFDVNGNATHNGVGRFLSGIIVGDTIIIPVDTGGTVKKSFELLTSKFKQKLSGFPQFGLNVAGEDYGVLAGGGLFGVQGQSIDGTGVFGYSGTSTGVHGRSISGDGVTGRSNSGTGVYGFSQEERGVLGQSINSFGIHGSSQTKSGVLGQSVNAEGVKGISDNSTGVYGVSQSGRGVLGLSTSNTGAYGQSTSNLGIWGISESERGVLGQSNLSGGVMGVSTLGSGIIGRGQFGGWFQNKVKIDEVPIAPNQERFLVWDADSVIKYRTLPAGGTFDGVLQDKALIVKNGAVEVFRVNTNGTSFHLGTESFYDDLILYGEDGKGIKLVGADNSTIAGFGRNDLETGQRIGVYGKAEKPGDLAGVFDGDIEVNGEIVTGSLHIVDGDGDTLTSFNADGTSLHTGLETYLAGIDLPDHNTENTTGNVKAGKFNGGLRGFSTGNNQQFPKTVKVPSVEKGFEGINPSTDNEPVIWGYTERTSGTSVFGQNTNTSNTYPAVWGANFGGGSGVLGETRNSSSAYPGMWAITYGTGSSLLIDHQGTGGNILTGRSSGVNQVRIDKTGKGFFNGGTQTGGADVAEAFEVEGEVEEYEPGDVLVISISRNRSVAKSIEPYSKLVIGVYATKPGVLLSRRDIDDDHEDTIPLGVIGIIPTKVCTENGKIQKGDLLVTSSLPGIAMKGTEENRMMGAVLGKALEDFNDSRIGVIDVMVNTK